MIELLCTVVGFMLGFLGNILFESLNRKHRILQQRYEKIYVPYMRYRIRSMFSHNWSSVRSPTYDDYANYLRLPSDGEIFLQNIALAPLEIIDSYNAYMNASFWFDELYKGTNISLEEFDTDDPERPHKMFSNVQDAFRAFDDRMYDAYMEAREKLGLGHRTSSISQVDEEVSEENPENKA